MGILWTYALAMVVSATCTQIQYFPKGSLDLRADGLKSQWYSRQLCSLEEPSLFSLKKDSTRESYRFLWLRTFNHPIAIRLDLHPDGTGVITTKAGGGAGGYAPGDLIENRSLTLKRGQIVPFLRQLQELSFWKLPNPVNDQTGTDGSDWVIEGIKGGHYHVVDRWSPESGAVHELGLVLLSMANENVPPKEIY
jgi:hypothetical protein